MRSSSGARRAWRTSAVSADPPPPLHVGRATSLGLLAGTVAGYLASRSRSEHASARPVAYRAPRPVPSPGRSDLVDLRDASRSPSTAAVATRNGP